MYKRQELYQFRFMLCLVLGSGLLKLDFLQAVIDRLQVLESSGAVIEPLNRFDTVSYTHLQEVWVCRLLVQAGQMILQRYVPL